MNDDRLRKCFATGLIAIICSLSIMPTVVPSSIPKYSLPPPLSVDMTLEEAIFRRMSVREFTEEPLTDEELSTILWAAYGYRDDMTRTVSGIEGTFAAHLYVLMEDAVYTYDPMNHSLIFFKQGDYRYIGQYEAPLQLGLVWDKQQTSNENYAAAELGEIGQNIQFVANAIGLGTVVTGDIPPWTLAKLGLPSHEVGRIIMPLGHPKHPYNFIYLPLWLSFLPRVQNSNISVTIALQERTESTVFNGELTREEVSQMLWSAYGYSYYVDLTKPEIDYTNRHRTVPSAHAYYPLCIYVVTGSGIFRYIPGLFRVDPLGVPIVTFLIKIRHGDTRDEVAQLSQSFVASASLLIIPVLDLKKAIQPKDDLSGEQFRWLWYYEAGAVAHNVLLEATVWDLSANIVPVTDTVALRSLLGLDDTNYPLLILPVGKEIQ